MAEHAAVDASAGGVLRSTRAFIRMSLSSEPEDNDDAPYSPTTMQELRALLPLVLSGDFQGLKARLKHYLSEKMLVEKWINGVLPGRDGKTLLHLAAALAHIAVNNAYHPVIGFGINKHFNVAQVAYT